MAVSDWLTTASSNSDIGGINIAENCPSGNMNNAVREVMAQLRAVLTDPVLSILGKATLAEIRTALDVPEGTAALDAIGGLTPAADRLPYYTGASTAALVTLTSFIRTLLDDADAATARSTLGAIGVSASSLANPGYIKFSLPGTSSAFMVAWGTFTADPNGSTSVNYAAAFPNASFAVCNGVGEFSGTAQDNNPSVYATTASGFTAWSAYNSSITARYIAVGY